ncbi:hypothetical protein JHK87_021660 [Glycine soja]|nr:hypothetical protein JHK87_021660 [Glycine soja]
MADDGADPFPKLTSVYRVSGSKNNKLSWNVANSQQSVDSSVNNSRQLQSISDGSASRSWFSQNSRPNAWEVPSVIQKLRLGKRGNDGLTNNSNLQDKSNSPDALALTGSGILNDSKLPPESAISPTSETCLNSSVDVVDTTTSKDLKNVECKDERIPEPHCEDNGSDIVFDSDDDCFLDNIDLDTGERSHEQCKKSKWLRNFFDKLNALTNEEISSLDRQWHCPACQGGSGAIDWYKGLQPLLDHSRTIQTTRARLHRMFAETLEEECFRRRAPLTTVGEVHNIWEGLDKKVKDHEIVWPPMVIIMNTRYEQDESNKWNGMGNQELVDCFSDYAALKARHSYGPQGHRGMSALIFEETTAGYLEAVRLHKHFKEQGRDREAWDCCQNPFLPGGKRQLYGYLASKEDLDIFNKHSGGKTKLKFEMRSYQEMVERKIKHINDDSRKLDYYKSMVAKEQIKSQVGADSLCKSSEKLSMTTEKNRVDQQDKEMDALEKNFQSQIQDIQLAIAAKEDKFVKLQLQAMQEKVKESCKESSEKEDKQGDEAIRGREREKIKKIHEEKKLALKKKQWQEQVELEKELENELTQLMDKYNCNQSQEKNC